MHFGCLALPFGRQHPFGNDVGIVDPDPFCFQGAEQFSRRLLPRSFVPFEPPAISTEADELGQAVTGASFLKIAG